MLFDPFWDGAEFHHRLAALGRRDRPVVLVKERLRLLKENDFFRSAARTGMTGAHRYVETDHTDNAFSLSLFSDGSGRFSEIVAYGGLTGDFAYHDVIAWSVEEFPEIGPVPLPASLPLPGVGLAAVGFIARRRKS